MIKSNKALALVVSVFCIISIITTYFAIPGPLQQEKILLVKRGSIYNVAEFLKEQKVISNKYSFWVLAQVFNIFIPLQAGEYFFDPGSSILRTIIKHKFIFLQFVLFFTHVMYINR